MSDTFNSTEQPRKMGVYMVEYEVKYDTAGDPEVYTRTGYAFWNTKLRRWAKVSMTLAGAKPLAYTAAPAHHTNQNIAWKVIK